MCAGFIQSAFTTPFLNTIFCTALASFNNPSLLTHFPEISINNYTHLQMSVYVYPFNVFKSLAWFGYPIYTIYYENIVGVFGKMFPFFTLVIEIYIDHMP